MNNRRNWIKETGLGILGMSLGININAQTITKEQPSNSDSMTLLGLNENPYGPSPKALIAMQESISNANRYAFKTTTALINAIAKKNEVTPENVLLAPGSTELLDLTFQLTSQNKGSYIIANNTFDYWTSTKTDSEFKRIPIPLTKDKKHDLKAMFNAIQTDTKLIYICNPNNPTGTICNRKELLSFIEKASEKVMILIDEAYIDYTEEESLGNLGITNKNVIITKTFSKLHGLAGARIGYAIGHTSTIKKLKELKSWPNGNLSLISMAGALVSLQDHAFTEKVKQLNKEAKEYTIKEFQKVKITTIPSYTNFLYFSLENYPKDYLQQLTLNRIKGSRIYEENGKWSRITIGNIEEMKILISALQ
ncbi:histidinol-phosphate transaminase [uncultured Maribacter sp.]|uniref:pyridoxal phosphate-dependent aminotransferase n=1 Tax=uncultured Maribacter sp. TaxID=431308 RepID=UPI002626E89B|nr:histidinol-phosphate transaminase [uncultured Maribacter sp.]